jgi:UDP-N-acetyl-D-mannosaminuronic acid dehydrogenase
VVEPNINELPPSLRGAELVTLDVALAQGDIHLMLVDHREFKAGRAPTGEIVDTRGVWRSKH